MRVLAFLVGVSAIAASAFDVSAKKTSCRRHTAKPTVLPIAATPTPVPATIEPTTLPGTVKPPPVPTATTKPTTAPVTGKPTTSPTSKPTVVPTTKPTTAPVTGKPTTTKPTSKPTTAPPVTTAPTAAPNATETGDEASSGLHFRATPNGILMNGAPFTFKGANYFGMESDILVPHGLWGGGESTTIQKVASLLKANNFNAVRLPFAVDAVLQNAPVDRSKIVNEVALLNSLNGKALSYLDVMDYTLKVFADNKLLVLLDAHVLSHSGGGIGELWYSSDADKSNFENAWKILATRYKNTWNVVGADLKNEPHGQASWGSGNAATDWRLASLKWATTILKISPRWLIFVEGIQSSSRDQSAYPCFWGGNLMDVERAPLTLPVAERLVYSPHVYGPNVASQSYFSDAAFPGNMPAIWDLHFGFVHNKHGPIVMGEWGGKYRDAADKKWQDKFAAYLKEKSIGSFYWSLNPNSGDTEGLLENNWNTPRADKLAMLSVFKGTLIP